MGRGRGVVREGEVGMIGGGLPYSLEGVYGRVKKGHFEPGTVVCQAF